jgi:hypothetical protein
MRRDVAIDLDNTLISYDGGWQGEDKFGDPIPGAKEALELFKKNGWKVIVWTCRTANKLIWDHLDKHFPNLIDELNANAEFENSFSYSRKIVADIYIDDRAWPFCGQQVSWKVVLEDLCNRGILVK